MLSQCDIYGLISDGRAAQKINGNWYGQLAFEGILDDEGYWLLTDNEEECEYEIEGIYTNFQNALTYDLKVHNNLISYPFSFSMDIEDIVVYCEDGTMRGSIRESIAAMCYDGNWIGSLQTFTPAYGYWFLVYEDITFQWRKLLCDGCWKIAMCQVLFLVLNHI